MNPRQEKGKEIAEKQNQIRRIDESTYSVRSQTVFWMGVALILGGIAIIGITIRNAL